MINRNVIVHAHIFKNAGSTFDDSLLSNFGENFVDHREDHLIGNDETFLKNYLTDHSSVNAFSSHSVFHYPKSFDSVQIHPVYFLRHPIERIRSVYSFEKKQPAEASLGAKMAKQLDFEGYVSWRMEETTPATIRNVQTIFLSGTGISHKNIEKKYEEALQNLENTVMVGVVDRYDESMVVFEEYLKRTYPDIDLSYIRKNITDTNIKASVSEKAEKILNELEEPLQELVKENNQFDLELYEKANVLLDEKVKEIEGFGYKLDNFRERCKLKQKFIISDNDNIKNNNQVAKTELKKIEVVSDNKSIQDYLEEAKKKSKLKLYKEALDVYKKIMIKFPNNPWAYFFQAEMYYLIGSKDKSRELFAKYKKQFEENSNISATFHKYLNENIKEFRTINKKNVFIQANCQSHAIKNIFRKVSRLNEEYEMIDIEPVHLWKEKDKEMIFEKLKECDIFLHQPISESNFGVFASDNLRKYLKKDAISVSFPNLYFTGYHPQAFYMKDADGKKLSEPFDYHDKNIYDLYLKGFSKYEILEKVEDASFYSTKEIENNIKKSLNELKEREQYTDITMSDYIEKNMIGQKLFHIFNHPNNKVIFYLFDKIIEKINEIPLTKLEKLEFKKEFLGAIEYPMYKSVQIHMNIEDKQLLNIRNKTYLYIEIITKYIKFYKENKC